MNQADPSCGWKARRQAVHSVAAQSKMSTTIETKSSWPQRILVADMEGGDAHGGAPVQRRSFRRRGVAQPGAEIGGSKGKVAPASKAPIHAAGTYDTADLPA